MNRTVFNSGLYIVTVFCFLGVLSFAISGCDKEDNEPKVTKVDILSMNPPSPASLKYYKTGPNDRVSITFEYTVAEADGVRIFVQPASTKGIDGTIHYSPSSVYTGSGSKVVVISVSSNEPEILIDQIKILVKSPDQSKVISESFVAVNYIFSSL